MIRRRLLWVLLLGIATLCAGTTVLASEQSVGPYDDPTEAAVQNLPISIGALASAVAVLAAAFTMAARYLPLPITDVGRPDPRRLRDRAPPAA